MLPSKTIPEVNRKGKGRMLKPKAKVLAAALPRKKAKMCSVEVEEVEDEDSTRNILSRNASVSSITEDVPNNKKVSARTLSVLYYSKTFQGVKKNPIHLFYEIVPARPDDKPGADGDVHYHCFHGDHKVCTIKKSMKSNLTGAFHIMLHLSITKVLPVIVLVNNFLKSIKPMYNLYCI